MSAVETMIRYACRVRSAMIEVELDGAIIRVVLASVSYLAGKFRRDHFSGKEEE